MNKWRAYDLLRNFEHQFCSLSYVIDPYAGECHYNCLYCYAPKNQSDDAPYSVKAIISQAKKTKSIVRIGGFSDPLPPSEISEKKCFELMNLLADEEIPYTLVTKSTLLTQPPYLSILRRSKAVVQISLCFADDKWRKQIEPNLPSIQERLDGIKLLLDAGITVIVRINPLFPMYPDQTFSAYSQDLPEPSLDLFSPKLFQILGEIGVKYCIVGFASLTHLQVKVIEEATGINLYSYMSEENALKQKGLIYSSSELVAYFSFLKAYAQQFGLTLSSCYLGQPPSFYKKLIQRDLSRENDCCLLSNFLGKNRLVRRKPIMITLFNSLLSRIIDEG